MVGSRDLKPSTIPFYPNVFWHNQFRAQPQWPSKDANLSGQTAIVTGSNTGLGYEAAIQLLELKLSHLIVAVRSVDRGQTAASAMRAQFPNARIDVWQLDMHSYASNSSFLETIESTGHEEMFQVNYLSTFFLLIQLLPVLKSKRQPGKPAHVTISSAALTLHAKFLQKHKNPLFPALDAPENYDRGDNYETSKLLAHMFLWKLTDNVSADDVIINLADPAYVRGTSFTRDIGDNRVLKAAAGLFGLMFGRTPKVGASCYVDAVVNKGKESHGCFLMSWKVHPFAAYLYTQEGQAVVDRVWNETLAEFEFAGARGIIESMQSTTR
ncbi:hypothetical protein GGR57DRAFT_506681 [Xylariaceae sp. FL1272]|nr:hypothetical protein GGR57DRAFT_506681 [Xylariaceae sp. FL1272]